MDYKIKELNISDIKPDKNQPRKTFDDELLQHLAESILSNGLLNPIEVDEDYIITDGERRFKAHKIAGLKTITARIVKTKDKTDKLRRQLIFTLQDEEINTDEKYRAIVELFKMEKSKQPTLTNREFCKNLGIEESLLKSALSFCEFAEEEPELAKQVSARVIADTKGLPKEERLELIKEFIDIPKEDKKTDLMRELVKEKRQNIEMNKKANEIKMSKDSEIRIKRTEEMLSDLRTKIDSEFQRINKLMFLVGRVRKTKLYLEKPKEKENFFKYIGGIIERVEEWSKELRSLRDNLELEVIST